MWPDPGRERGRQWTKVDRVDRSTGVDSRQQVDSRQRSTGVESGHAWFLSTFGRQWSTVVDSGSTGGWLTEGRQWSTVRSTGSTGSTGSTARAQGPAHSGAGSAFKRRPTQSIRVVAERPGAAVLCRGHGTRLVLRAAVCEHEAGRAAARVTCVACEHVHTPAAKERRPLAGARATGARRGSVVAWYISGLYTRGQYGCTQTCIDV